jgi:predicted 2-oxoglutarate/Fe(II)-dependent dioxygenase YbiX
MINNVLTPEECAEVIELAEQSGFQPAAIYDAATKTVHRNCTRRMIDDDALAENWFERILHALNDTPYEHKVKDCPWLKEGNESLHAVSLNEQLRVNRYAQGQFYTKHLDAAFTRGSDAGDREGEKSLMSVHIYLNDGYKGGITRFHGGGRWFDVNTKMGSVLLFEASIPHEAAKVTKGEKYVVRSDIMYSSKADLSEVAGTGFTQQL